ncbi:MAG: class II fructose-1,6-bisphosphate aldolase [Pseudothermotoga sp.]
MPLVSSKEMFKKAYGKYAIGAFNVNNMEILQGVIEAAKEEKAPLILQISAGARKYAKQVYLMKLIEAATQDAPEIPICVHLDHGDSFELCKAVIDGGFTSVMIDGSHLPFEENVKLTKQVVDYAHPRGVVVEGELGRLVGVEEHVVVSEKEASYTDPDKAVEFVERTGVDSLAIAIGTSHGAYKFKGEPKLDFDRLSEIAKRLPGFPLVLHGASSVLQDFVEKANKYGGKLSGAQGVPEEMIRKATTMGICKVNIDTDLRLAMTATIREIFALHPEEFDPRKYLGPAREAIKELVKHKMRAVLGCSGQA